MKDKDKTKKIIEVLDSYYHYGNNLRRYVTFPELRLGSGYSNNSQRRVDYFVIDSNLGNVVTGYEIKVSRQDFLKDIKDPLKQRGARQYCNEFYYICFDELIKPEEVPLWAGLIQLVPHEYAYSGYRLKVVVESPFYEKTIPTWGLICAMIRKLNKRLDKIGIGWYNCTDCIYFHLNGAQAHCDYFHKIITDPKTKCYKFNSMKEEE